MMNASGRWNRLGGAAVVLALAMAAAACSDGQSPVSPAAAGPGSLSATDGQNNGDLRYKATISPVTTSSGASTAFTLDVINCTEGQCGANNASGSNQTLGYAEIAVPSGFGTPATLAVTARNATTNAAVAKTWTVNFAAGVISVRATQGNQRIGVGEKVSITFTSTAPSACTSYTWNTQAWKADDKADEFVQVGAEPQVAVEGCSSGCTYGQGYWKNHEEFWPVSSLTLGSVSYTKTQLLSILNQPANPGNGLVTLAYQLIAAKLNVANGADATAVAAAIVAADALIGSLEIPPVGGDSLEPSAVGALKDALENYNTGVTGPGACGVE
jgi:hypothetical protein